MHFRRGYGLVPIDLGFRLCPNPGVAGLTFFEDEGLGFRRENFGNRVDKRIPDINLCHAINR